MKNEGDTQRGWRGRTITKVEPTRHRWQLENNDVTAAQEKASQSSSRRALGLLLSLSLGLLSVFVFLLLYAPIKTPMVVVGATSYPWPIPPNGWAKEDIDGLRSLAGKVFEIRDSSSKWQTKSACLEDLQAQLKNYSQLSKRAGAIVLYLNMHGAVNEEGSACLIPPSSSITATTQWITLEELASTIVSNTPAGVQVLLALDCVHVQMHWETGQLNNTFVDRLSQWATKSRPDSLIVLSSCSSDERSWAGPDIQNSIFGRELRLGLAGAADRLPQSSQPGVGNADGEVSVEELVKYLTQSVNLWVKSHRGVSQTPCYWPKKLPKVRVSWALKDSELKQQILSSKRTEIANPIVPFDEMDSLWNSLEELRQYGVYRHDPKNWALLERKVVWLEQLSTSGSAYTELASKQLFPSLKSWISESLAKARKHATLFNEIAKANILRDYTESVDLPTRLPSLALQEYLGEISADLATQLRSKILDSATNADESISEIAASVGLASQPTYCTELNFLGIAKRFDVLNCWPNRETVREFFRLRDRCERVTLKGDIRGHHWYQSAIDELDKERRSAEDRLLLGLSSEERAIDTSNIWNSLQASLDSLDGENGVISIVSDAYQVRDRALSEIAYLSAWVCSPDVRFDNLGPWS